MDVPVVLEFAAVAVEAVVVLGLSYTDHIAGAALRTTFCVVRDE